MLGVTTVLTMTTQLTSSRSTSMHVSYPKAMDVWYSSCMVFVFGALIEYAFVNVCARREKRFQAAKEGGGGGANEGRGGGAKEGGGAKDGDGLFRDGADDVVIIYLFHYLSPYKLNYAFIF